MDTAADFSGGGVLCLSYLGGRGSTVVVTGGVHCSIFSGGALQHFLILDTVAI